MTNQKTIILSCIAIIAAFIGLSIVFDIDLVRWFTCSSPFAAPQDKASDVCKRLDDAP